MFKYSFPVNCLCADSYGFSGLEVTDSALGMPIWKLGAAELEALRVQLIKSMKRIVLYTVFEIPSDSELPVLFRNAHMLGIENLRVPIEMLENEAVREMAEVMGIMLVIDYFVGCEDRYIPVRGEFTGLVFDPADLVKTTQSLPYRTILGRNKIKDDIRFIIANDGLKDGTPALPGYGHAETKECISHMLARSFDGYLSVSTYGGFTLDEVKDKLTKLLCEM